MTDPTLTISIARTSLSLPPLLFSATHDGTALGVVEYQPPAMQARIEYAPDVPSVHGSAATSWAWQESILGWSGVLDDAAGEAAVQASYTEVLAAITQWSYAVTTQVNGAPAQVWSCRPGSQIPDARTYADLANSNPVYAVTIPVYPIPA